MRLGVVGAGGRMGRMIIRQLAEEAATGVTLVGAVDRPEAPGLGLDAALMAGCGQPIGVRVGDDPVPLFADADAVIDFTSPAATVAHARLAAQGKTVHVVGTTGLADADEDALGLAARHCPVVYAPNMSVGVTLLLALVETVAAALPAEDFDIEIQEMHHRHKVDAPSGTALGLGRAAAAGRNTGLEAVRTLSRVGQTGERETGTIGFATSRGGAVVGDHTVVFAGDYERVELVHKAADRKAFAAGALRAARWAYGKPPGLYSMRDVLGI